MSWRDTLRTASFRGVNFGVESSEGTAGGRDVTTSYPLRQEPFVEWMGRKVRTYKVTGFLVGDNYPQQLEKLQKAFERHPSGYPFRSGSTLIHPYLGEIRVVARMLRFRHDFREGRMVRLEMDFVEAGRESGPPVTTGSQVGKAAKAKAASDAIASDITEQGLQVKGVGQSAYQAISNGLSSFSTALKGLDVFSGPAADVAAFGFKVNNIAAQAAALATAPANMVFSIASTLETMEAALGSAIGSFYAYELLLGLSPELIGGSGAAAVAADANALLTYDYWKSIAVAGAVVAGVQVDWGSLEEAQGARSRLLDSLDDLLTRAPDNLFAALADVRISAANGIPAPAADLPSIVNVTLESSLPAVVLANRLYDRPQRDAEIIRRNRIRHPLFVSGGVPLEVLSD